MLLLIQSYSIILQCQIFILNMDKVLNIEVTIYQSNPCEQKVELKAALNVWFPAFFSTFSPS